MSENTDNPNKPVIEPEKKKKLLAMIEAGIDPSAEPKLPKTTPEPVTPNFDIEEKDKVFNEENFKKLIANQEKLTEHIVKKDVDIKRKVILDEIKELDEEEFEVQKENYSLNELSVSLRMARKKKPQENKRDVGGKEGEDKDERPNTQYDHYLKKFVPG